MNLTSTVEVFAVGTSEGAKRAWDTRGRGRKDPEKVERARATHVNVTGEKIKKSAAYVDAIASQTGGVPTPDHSPWDILYKGGKVGIEVKVLEPDRKNAKVTVHPESKERKIASAKRLGMEKMFIVAVSEMKGNEGIFIRRAADPSEKRPGWSFYTKFMNKVSSMKEIRKYIK